jgi:hypothetical protein
MEVDLELPVLCQSTFAISSSELVDNLYLLIFHTIQLCLTHYISNETELRPVSVSSSSLQSRRKEPIEKAGNMTQHTNYYG